MHFKAILSPFIIYFSNQNKIENNWYYCLVLHHGNTHGKAIVFGGLFKATIWQFLASYNKFSINWKIDVLRLIRLHGVWLYKNNEFNIFFTHFSVFDLNLVWIRKLMKLNLVKVIKNGRVEPRVHHYSSLTPCKSC